MASLQQQPQRLTRGGSKRSRGRLLLVSIGLLIFMFLSLSWLSLDLSTDYPPAGSLMDWGGEMLNTNSSVTTATDTSLYSVTTAANTNSSVITTTAAAATPITIAYAISLVKCGDKQSSAPGLVDAALVMRHSIHMTSVRHPDSGSKYDYKMYALVHPNAVECSGVLKDAGFEILIKEPPVNASEIESDFLRENIHNEWCCGSDEFIKLYAFTLPEPIVVHVDIDFAFYKPMDDLFDAIIYDKDSPKGMKARSKIPLERPSEGFPDTIGAFVTRDWPQVVPRRRPLYQAGFLVARTNHTVLDEVVNTIKTSHYEKGNKPQNGWGGLGYGGFVGAMAMQGLMAYYYDVVRRNSAVEVNQCRYNWMGMDVLYRAPPNFKKNHRKVGKCRNNQEYCEDCMHTDLELVYNVHYTQCRKPWNCVSEGGGSRGPNNTIDLNAGDLEACLKVISKWHEVRMDFEEKLYALTKDETISKGQVGEHKRDLFQGHCSGTGGENYNHIQASPGSFRLITKLYE